MLAMTTRIQERLRALPMFADWDVRTDLEHSDRQPLPAIDVRCGPAGVTDSENSKALLAPTYAVILVVKRSSSAAGQLDQAMQCVIASLHNWRPGNVAGHAWRRMVLSSVGLGPDDDPSAASYLITFTTSAVYQGSL